MYYFVFYGVHCNAILCIATCDAGDLQIWMLIVLSLRLCVAEYVMNWFSTMLWGLHSPRHVIYYRIAFMDCCRFSRMIMVFSSLVSCITEIALLFVLLLKDMLTSVAYIFCNLSLLYIACIKFQLLLMNFHILCWQNLLHFYNIV